MARTPATFKHADVVRAVKAARAAGLNVRRTEITSGGAIVLHHENDNSPSPGESDELNEWDSVHDEEASEVVPRVRR